jgi:hypothetical protein
MLCSQDYFLSPYTWPEEFHTSSRSILILAFQSQLLPTYVFGLLFEFENGCSIYLRNILGCNWTTRHQIPEGTILHVRGSVSLNGP